MSVALWVVGGLLSLAGIGVGVVYWIKRAGATSEALDQRTATLQLEQSHVAALEEAEAAGRVSRAEEFDGKAAAATTAISAADLLREQLSGPGKSDRQ